MRRALALACLVAGAAPAAAQDPSPGDHAFVETATARTTYFVGEPVRVTLRFGFDPEYFRMNVIPEFRRALDLPARVEAPWMRETPGGLEPAGVAAPGTDAPRLTFALNDAAVSATRAADVARAGRTFGVLEVERRFVPRTPGDVTLAAPVLRFAYTSRFDDDLIHGRVPVDRRDAAIPGAPIVLTIRPLPDAGRPAGFGGAIGRFTVTADAARTELAAGETLVLTLRIEGDGNLDSFDPPHLGGLAGFHVYGMLDDKGAAVRTVKYEIAPLGAAVREVPPIAFDYFDTTGPGAYRTARTAPIPIVVRGPSGAAPPSTDAAPAQPSKPAERGLPDSLTIVGVLSTIALLVAVWRTQRRRAAASSGGDPAAARARGAADAFRASAATQGTDVANAFAEYLAARLGCAPAAVISPDLAARLTASGVPSALAARTAEFLEQAVAARYGAADARVDAGAARSLVGELETAFASRA